MEVAFFWFFQQKLTLFDQFSREIVGFFDNRVYFYSSSVFERKKRLRSFKNPSVQCDFQSEILQKHKTLITLDWGLYLTSKGHFCRLHFFEFFNKNWDFLINFTMKSYVFLIIESNFTLSRLLKEKNDEGLSKIHQSSVISNLKFSKNIKHS